VKRPADISPKEHEQSWTEEPKLRSELTQLRQDLARYAEALAIIANVDC